MHFNFSGFASVRDIEREDWQKAFNELQVKSQMFLNEAAFIYPDAYKWPKDSLNAVTRIWEYPWAYLNIESIVRANADPLQICDFGSGVTFFSHSVAELGCTVTCLDVDAVCIEGVRNAADHCHVANGVVEASLIENGKICLNDNSQDLVYCISVIEHIESYEMVIDEIFRVLKPGGHFIFTFDVDLRGNFEIGPTTFEALLAKINSLFAPECAERVIHPRELFTTFNSPNASKSRSKVSALRKTMTISGEEHALFSELGPDMLLAVYAARYVKR